MRHPKKKLKSNSLPPFQALSVQQLSLPSRAEETQPDTFSLLNVSFFPSLLRLGCQPAPGCAEHPPPPASPHCWLLHSRKLAERTHVLVGEEPALYISHPLQEIQPDLVCHSHSKVAFLPAGQFPNLCSNIIYGI